MKKRRIDRGTDLREQAAALLPADKRAIEELVKGSYDYLMAQIRGAFYSAFSSWRYESDEPWFYIDEVFAEHLIVCSEGLPPDERYLVTYSLGADGKYEFAPRPEWELVELTYQPTGTALPMDPALAPMTESRRRKRVEIVEALTDVSVGAADASGARTITAYGITADTVNGNGRRYPKPVLAAALTEATQRRGQFGARAVLGEDQHPSDKGQRAAWLETIIRWDSWVLESDGRVKLTGVIVPTSKGLDAITLLEHEVFPGISQRAWGYADVITEGGAAIEQIVELHITGYDTVMEPSDPNGAVTMIESTRATSPDRAPAAPRTRTAQTAGGPTVEITIEQLKERYPDLVKQILAESDTARRDAEIAKLQQKYLLDEAATTATAAAKAEGDKTIAELQESAKATAAKLAAFEEAERARAVATHITAKVAELKQYSEAAKSALLADVLDDKPATNEAADALLARRQKTLDAALAQGALAGMGYAPSGQARPGVTVVGPVIEQATGQPAYARPMIALHEAMAARGYVPARPAAAAPKTRAELLAAAMLARFDELHRDHLIAEARRYDESLTTSDLNLPYSASRAIIAEAVPLLVAAEVFDVSTIDTNPTLVYYESFSYETGGQPTVTAEDVTADLNGWVSLANKRVNVGSVVVTNAAASVTYVEGTDYLIDYAEGKIMAIATITDNQALKATYTYQAMRKGEGATIERGKVGLSFVTLTCAADRLAAQVTSEAVLFSRSQLGWDATTRTVNALIERIQRKIDGDLMLTALQNVLQVASNSGGTWTAASDTLAALVAKIGVAKLKVQNRNFMPTSILMSATNADRLTNPENNFHIFGAAGVTIDASGRLNVKGLPVFSSTNFRDDYILVQHRELLQHRIYQPMMIKGPFPTYDQATAELIAAEQYYVETYSGTVSPLKTKGSYVKVA